VIQGQGISLSSGSSGGSRVGAVHCEAGNGMLSMHGSLYYLRLGGTDVLAQHLSTSWCDQSGRLPMNFVTINRSITLITQEIQHRVQSRLESSVPSHTMGSNTDIPLDFHIRLISTIIVSILFWDDIRPTTTPAPVFTPTCPFFSF
jgi:hypothetical protein